jgi:hypothetical protein
MYNNSYVNHQFGLKIIVQLKKWFTITLEVACHGIINNMESSGGDSYLRHGCECIHRVVTQNWVPSSDCLDLDHNLLTVQ